MQVISLKAGRRFWLMVLDGCEIGTPVRVSRPVYEAVREAKRCFPGASIDAPAQTRPLFVAAAGRSEGHQISWDP